MAIKKKAKTKRRAKKSPAIEASFKLDAGEDLEARIKDWCDDKDCKPHGKNHRSCGGGWFYFLGYIGALVHFWQQAEGFWPSLGAIFRALGWPAYLVFKWLGG